MTIAFYTVYNDKVYVPDKHAIIMITLVSMYLQLVKRHLIMWHSEVSSWYSPMTLAMPSTAL